jgi:AcrR family transcriptional regulator
MAEPSHRKRPRRTRERILEASLLLFNRDGEPRTTSADIAHELEISPGNLYYHFRSKRDIVESLFSDFERRFAEVHVDAMPPGASVEELWLIMHLQFEAMWDFRFLYRDLDEIFSREGGLAGRFSALIMRLQHTVQAWCATMISRGDMEADSYELEALANNVALVSTYWISFRKLHSRQRDDQGLSLNHAAYQTLSLVAPFLRGDARALLDRLRGDYLS